MHFTPEYKLFFVEKGKLKIFGFEEECQIFSFSQNCKLHLKFRESNTVSLCNFDKVQVVLG